MKLPLEGLVLTVGSTRPVQESLPFALPHAQRIRPDFVMPHMYPDVRVPRIAQALRAALPGVRLLIQTPANTLVDDRADDCERKVRAWTRACVEVGAEALVFNGEGASGVGGVGWKTGQPLRGEALAARAALVLGIAADEAKGELLLGWSTHDQLASHGRAGLPVGVFFGSASPVALNFSQEYTFTQPRVASWEEAVGRHKSTARDTLGLADKGVIRRELASGGTGYGLIAQAHHHTVEAAGYYHDQSALSGAWTLEPGSCDAQGLLALAADADLRRRFGHAPGRIARARAVFGLAPGRLDAALLAKLGVR